MMSVKVLKESEVNPNIPEILTRNRWYLFCPGCYENAKQKVPDNPAFWIYDALHCFNDTIHSFNKDVERPTLCPSLLCSSVQGPNGQKYICHSFVREGRIEFLGDCTHALAGQTVDLLDVQRYLDQEAKYAKRKDSP